MNGRLHTRTIAYAMNKCIPASRIYCLLLSVLLQLRLCRIRAYATMILHTKQLGENYAFDDNIQSNNGHRLSNHLRICNSFESIAVCIEVKYYSLISTNITWINRRWSSRRFNTNTFLTHAMHVSCCQNFPLFVKWSHNILVKRKVNENTFRIISGWIYQNIDRSVKMYQLYYFHSFLSTFFHSLAELFRFFWRNVLVSEFIKRFFNKKTYI